MIVRLVCGVCGGKCRRAVVCVVESGVDVVDSTDAVIKCWVGAGVKRRMSESVE